MFELVLAILVVVSFILGFYAKDWAKCNTWEAKVRGVFLGEKNEEQEKFLLSLCASTLGKVAKRKAKEKKVREICKNSLKKFPTVVRITQQKELTPNEHKHLNWSFGIDGDYLTLPVPNTNSNLPQPPQQ